MAGKASKKQVNKALKSKAGQELIKCTQQNRTLIGQLLTIANDPNSDLSKKIIEYYRNELIKLKNDTINPDSDIKQEATVIPITAPASDQSN